MTCILNSKSKKQIIKKATSVALLGTVCVASIFSAKAFARDVYVNVDNTTIHSVTIDNNINKILDKVGVNVADNDIVETIDEPEAPLKLNVKRAFDFQITDGNTQINMQSAGGTVGDALKSAGVSLGEYDIINFSLDAELTKNMKILITRRIKVSVLADGEQKQCIIPISSSVLDALKYAKVSLADEDVINFNLSDKTSADMEIVINRIRHEEVVSTESIPRNVVTKTSTLLYKGEEEISTEGKDGIKEIKTLQTFKDKELVDSQVMSESVIEEPVDKVIMKGTREKPIAPKNSTQSCTTSSEKASSIIYGSATAYTAPSGARTSTGAIPREGVTVAVNPKKIPYGSKILVESVDGSFKQVLTAQDTGGALRQGSAAADIYMNSQSACRNFGRKQVKISILS